MKLITNSSTGVAQRCLREYYFRYVLCRRTSSTKEMDVGTVWGAALDAWAGAYQYDCGSADGWALGVAIQAIDDKTDDLYTAAMLRALMAGYHYRWAPAMANYIVRGIEREFDLPLDNPDGGRSRSYRRAGKRDKDLLDVQTGEVVVMEHKTTASDIAPEEVYIRRLALDAQVSEYLDSLGGESITCVYDVVHKPQARPLKATVNPKHTKGKKCKGCKGTGKNKSCGDCRGSGWKEEPRLYAGHREHDETPAEFEARLLELIADNPNKYYQRATITRSHDQLVEHRRSLWSLSVRLVDAHRTESWPRNTHACMRYRRLCSYFPVCSGSCSIDDSRYTTTEPHQELHGRRTSQTTIGFDDVETQDAEQAAAHPLPRPPGSRQNQLGTGCAGQGDPLRPE